MSVICSTRVWWTLLAACVLGFLLATRFALQPIATAQWYLVPPLVILMALAAQRRWISLACVLIAVAGICVSSLRTFREPGSVARGIDIALRADDLAEQQSSKLREAFDFELRGTNSSAVRYGVVVTSEREARELLELHGSKRPLVWTNDQRLGVVFRIESNRIINAPLPLEMVMGVDAISLPMVSMRESVHFLATFVRAVSETALGVAEREGLLSAAAASSVSGRGQGYRAYAWFLLGNFALDRALSGGTFQLRELQCALAAYRRASRYLKGAGEPGLHSALYNNRGVALLIGAEHTGKRSMRKKGIRALRSSVRMARVISIAGGSLRAPLASLHNLAMPSRLKKAGKKGKPRPDVLVPQPHFREAQGKDGGGRSVSLFTAARA